MKINTKSDKVNRFTSRGTWFRIYTSDLNDPYLQTLPSDLFRSWVNLCALAAQNGGILPDNNMIAFALRITEREAESATGALIQAGLVTVYIDAGQPIMAITNWHTRQFVSDRSAKRTKKHRQQKRSNNQITDDL